MKKIIFILIICFSFISSDYANKDNWKGWLKYNEINQKKIKRKKIMKTILYIIGPSLTLISSTPTIKYLRNKQ